MSFDGQISSMEKVISDSSNKMYEYYYFDPEIYTDENDCLIPNKKSGAYSSFENFIKSNKIPEYAKDYKREYQFIIGINKEFRYFIYKPEDVSGYQFFHNLHVKKIIKLLKMFLRNQEKGIFSKEFNGLKLEGKDIFNLKYFYDNILGKILKSNKEKEYNNFDLNRKLNNYFNFVYLQIRKKIIVS